MNASHVVRLLGFLGGALLIKRKWLEEEVRELKELLRMPRCPKRMARTTANATI